MNKKLLNSVGGFFYDWFVYFGVGMTGALIVAISADIIKYKPMVIYLMGILSFEFAAVFRLGDYLFSRCSKKVEEG